MKLQKIFLLNPRLLNREWNKNSEISLLRVRSLSSNSPPCDNGAQPHKPQVITFIPLLLNKPPKRNEQSHSCALNSDQFVRFGTNKDLQGFNDKDIKKIRKIISRCIYVKDLETLINPPEKLQITGKAFKADYNHTDIVFYNFRFPSLGGHHDNIGVCDDLAWHYKNILEKEFDGKYVFKIVSGINNKHFPRMNHYFLLAWPNDENRDNKIRSDLKKDPAMFPKGCLIVDPSLNIVGPANSDFVKEHGYELHDFVQDNKFPLKTCDELQNSSKNPNYQTTLGASLGYLKHLDYKNSLKTQDKKMIVILRFRHYWDKDRPEVSYALMDSKGNITDWDNWRNEVASDSILKRFADKIESDFKK